MTPVGVGCGGEAGGEAEAGAGIGGSATGGTATGGTGPGGATSSGGQATGGVAGAGGGNGGSSSDECLSGVTRPCVGTGECEGAQSCSDWEWGACECGAVSSNPRGTGAELHGVSAGQCAAPVTLGSSDCDSCWQAECCPSAEGCFGTDPAVNTACLSLDECLTEHCTEVPAEDFAGCIQNSCGGVDEEYGGAAYGGLVFFSACVQQHCFEQCSD